EIPMSGGVGSGTFRYAIVVESCQGVGTLEGSGTVDLRAEGDGYLGTVTTASDLFGVVTEDGGNRCIGGRSTYDLAAVPA
ncbi:MAG TPA: hypothetical protein VFZ30_01075, partial [Acidimicrobiales bacterium]